MEGDRELTWEERRDLLTKEQYDGIIDENGMRTGFGYISPFTEKVIHYWLNCYNIPKTTKEVEEWNKKNQKQINIL
jgi:hypothetical protein